MKRAVVSSMVMGLILCAAAEWAMAVPIASDSFDYPEGLLAGSEGGSGWSHAWEGGAPEVKVMWTGLEYTDSKDVKLSVAGNSVKTGGLSKREINLDTESRPELAPFVQNGILGVDGTTIWICSLAHMDNNTAWDYIDLRAGGVSKMVMGRESTVPNWGLGSFPNVQHEGKTSIEKDVFFVVRIDFKDGDDTVYLWTNPDLDIEPAVRDADITTSRDVEFDSVWLHGCGDDVQFDELRIGTLWKDLIREVEANPKGEGKEEEEEEEEVDPPLFIF